MSRFLRGFAVHLAVSSLLVVLIALPSSGQEPSAGNRQEPGDDPSIASDRARDRGEGDAKDVAAKDQDGAGTEAGGQAGSKTKAKAKPEPEFVRKTDAEWRKILTKTQYMVTRQKATEPAFSGKYATGHFRGTFLCVCCGAELFNAQNKFDSGTGWPSFDRPASLRAIGREMDYGGFEPRVEVMCRRCGAHLGHVFDDGPTITTLRFCINSASIKLRPPEGESASTDRESSRNASNGRTKARSKSSVKAKAKAKPKAKAQPAAAARGTKESSEGTKGEDRDVPANSEKRSSD
jgi:peptide-methionine (R)-S-oxide reductase